ncbi:hypothetical protein ACEWY4_017231 [Coilia grayii]|uniref:AIG1-type G domain-containing protein n=1 Tax=Coilia grayii TaxID=363190 RepID=A0ABD1JGJ7_9TELE
MSPLCIHFQIKCNLFSHSFTTFKQGHCDICLGEVQKAAKYCKTCNASFCESHLTTHYKAPALTSHELELACQNPPPSLAQGNSVHVRLPELRVMLLGRAGAGKSASGNTILGREAFKTEVSAVPVTESCDSQSGVVAERHLTVIDTPGITRKAAWVLNVDKPDMFFLVIHLARFTEEGISEMNWIQKTFGEEALKFTIVLFTGGDQLKGKTVEEFLEESTKLQTLLDVVKGRCHVFDNNNPSHPNQVKELIVKIENALMKSVGYGYTHALCEKVKIDVIQEEEAKKSKERTRNEEKKNMRENEAHIPGNSWIIGIILSVLMFIALHFYLFCISAYCPEDPVKTELKVILLGRPGAGKSASGNTILGREAFKVEASTLPVTKYCEVQSGVVERRNITVIDTPGITSKKAAWLTGKDILDTHVFLLVIHVGRFTEDDSIDLEWMKTNFGVEALKFTIVLFTGGDLLEQKTVEEFLAESPGLQAVVNSVGGAYHILSNKHPNGQQQVKGLLAKVESLLQKNMGYSYSYGLYEEIKVLKTKLERNTNTTAEGKHREKLQISQIMTNIEKKIERRIKEQMKWKMMSRIANPSTALDELMELRKATAQEKWNYVTLMAGITFGVMLIGFVMEAIDSKRCLFRYFFGLFLFAVIGLLYDHWTFLIGVMSSPLCLGLLIGAVALHDYENNLHTKKQNTQLHTLQNNVQQTTTKSQTALKQL